MPASNMSVQPGRPSMKEDDHPDHNMPAPQHDGTVLGVNSAAKGNNERKDQTRYGDDSSKDATVPMTNETSYFIDRNK